MATIGTASIIITYIMLTMYQYNTSVIVMILILLLIIAHILGAFGFRERFGSLGFWDSGAWGLRLQALTPWCSVGNGGHGYWGPLLGVI